MELNEKISILEFLIKNYNDGRKKSFYCIAVNLLNLSDLKSIKEQIDNQIINQNIDIKAKLKLIIDILTMEVIIHTL